MWLHAWNFEDLALRRERALPNSAEVLDLRSSLRSVLIDMHPRLSVRGSVQRWGRLREDHLPKTPQRRTERSDE
jgi:hypothetical protein